MGDQGTGSTARRVLRRLDDIQQSQAWLGFPHAVIKKFGEDKAGYLAALVSYWGFFSLFPLLLVMFTVLGFVLADNPDLQQRIVDATFEQFPFIGVQLRESIGTIDGNGTALAIGVIGAMWAGMAAVRAMQHALDSVWGVPAHERPNMVMSRARSLLLLIMLGGGALAITAVAAAGPASQKFSTPANVVASLIAALFASGVFLVAFKVLSSAGHPWRDHLPGAIVGGVLFVFLQLVGVAYVSRVVQGAEATYGLFAVVIGLLSWMHLQAQFAVFSAEVNVVLAQQLWPRRLPGGSPTEVDRTRDVRLSVSESEAD